MRVKKASRQTLQRGRQKRPPKPYDALIIPGHRATRATAGGFSVGMVSRSFSIDLNSKVLVEHVGNAVAAHIYRHLSLGKYPNTGWSYPTESPPRYRRTGYLLSRIARASVRGVPTRVSRTTVRLDGDARYNRGPKSTGYDGMFRRDGNAFGGVWPFWVQSGGLTDQTIDLAMTQYLDAAAAGWSKKPQSGKKFAQRLVVSGY